MFVIKYQKRDFMTEIKKPNIFFLLIDSFRSDKFFGKEKTSVTPNLDSITQKGVYFSQAVNTAPASIPAISSVLTGKWPFKAIVKGPNRHQLNRVEPNFINQFNELGYHTFALNSKIFEDSELTSDFKVTEQFGGGLYDGMGQKIIEIIERLEEPWFFFIHSLDIHGTARDYPEKFNNEKYGFNQYERRISALDPWLGKFFKKIDLEKTLVVLTADHSTDRGIYTPEMEQLQSNLNKNNLQRFVGVGSKLLFGCISKKAKKAYLARKVKTKTNKQNKALENQKHLDPYEKRIKNNLIRPGYDIFDNRYRIPILFSGLGLESQIIDKQIRSLDIFPTIFDIIKIPSGIKCDGQSVLPLINCDPSDELPVFMENIPNWIVPKEGTIPAVGIRFQGFKYFRSRDNSNENVNLYDLHNDPHEENNLANDMPEKLDKMEKMLLNFNPNINKTKFENEIKKLKK